MFYTYRLLDTETGAIFYIGETKKPDRRRQEHTGCKVQCTKGYIDKLNKVPDLEILGEFSTEAEAKAAEKQMIKDLTKRGVKLQNNFTDNTRRPDEANHGAPWTEDDRRQYDDLYSKGASRDEIARIMKRSASSIRWAEKRANDRRSAHLKPKKKPPAGRLFDL